MTPPHARTDCLVLHKKQLNFRSLDLISHFASSKAELIKAICWYTERLDHLLPAAKERIYNVPFINVVHCDEGFCWDLGTVFLKRRPESSARILHSSELQNTGKKCLALLLWDIHDFHKWSLPVRDYLLPHSKKKNEMGRSSCHWKDHLTIQKRTTKQHRYHVSRVEWDSSVLK